MHSAKPNPLAHRDIKPHNILLTKDIRPVIMDLGSTALARVKINNHSEAQHLQDVAAERCSMPYRPPELFQVNFGNYFVTLKTFHSDSQNRKYLFWLHLEFGKQLSKDSST